MTLEQFIQNLISAYKRGNATENTYCVNLKQLIESIVPDVAATNETQYFDNVPEVAWNFYIKGYQPAQKWLKDRKELKLEFDDIAHYKKIIVALTETDRLMKAIDTIAIE
ncbi:type ISP restriction/modification enzyme [Flavobacterium sp. XS1P32]|uniref:type ISP restriction/modification enzyme n=1 Tax=unclassified Flavobacterium TaxID=196869 RepID=UPI003AADCE65